MHAGQSAPAEVVLRALDAGDVEVAWRAFLDAFAPAVLQVVRRLERDEDNAGECFVYACERLAEHGCRRLRTFDRHAGTQFVTWLRAVTRNLAVDWRRRRSGRFRVFEPLTRAPILDQAIFLLRFRERLAPEMAFARLQTQFPGLEWRTFAERDARVAGSLTSEQHWKLAAQYPREEPIDPSTDEAILRAAVASGNEDTPERVLLSRDLSRRLSRVVKRLAPADRLLLRLRYIEGLTLARVAAAVGLRDAQHADRRIRALLARLRFDLERGGPKT